MEILTSPLACGGNIWVEFKTKVNPKSLFTTKEPTFTFWATNY